MRNKKYRVKHSISRQFATIFIGLMASTIFLCWFINNSFLQQYYENNREKTLLECYQKIINAAEEGKLEDAEFQNELVKLSSRSNISAIIVDANAEVAMTIGGESQVLLKLLKDNLFSYRHASTRELEKTEDYTLQKVVDVATQLEFIEMYGIVGTGVGVLVRTPLANISESVMIANRFLVYIGLIAIAISSTIIYFVTRKVTEPIMELADISERMIQLDFEAKYTGRNNTEISILGDNINKLSETLEQTISELKTANNELQKDIEVKTRIDEMRTEFLSNVSHELKTPIALIQGYAEGLSEGINDDAESRSFYCEVIMDEANKMNVMVKKLLTLNQLEFGSDVVAFERFDIVDLICNYVQSAQILTKQNNIQVQMGKYDPIYVWADEFKTEEVFMNYFTNAVNHAGGDKIIDIKLEQKEKKIRVSIFNTGEPVPGDSIEHLWEKFYKVDKARTRAYGGSGVGLSIVKAIMESMNQEYGVINYENGVEFWFELETVQ